MRIKLHIDNVFQYTLSTSRVLKLYSATLLSVLLMLLTINKSVAAMTYIYQQTTNVPANWIDISTTGTAVTLTDDSASGNIALGFTFTYGTTNYTQLSIGSNGWLFFGATSTEYTNTALPQTAAPNATMLPFWVDLNPGAGGQIRYQSFGTAPNRYFVVSYLAVPIYNTANLQSFQAVIYENGNFAYNYKTTTTQGNSSTVGYQVSNTDYVQYSFLTASEPNNSTILWRPLPLLSNGKTVSVISDPVNGTVNPKFIPSAIVQYNLQVSNSGRGSVDNNTITLTDVIPSNVKLFTGNLSGGAPYFFTDGSPSSTVTCPFVSLASTTDCIDFSNNSGSTWNYTPNGAYDAAVTNVRFMLTGAMSGDLVAGSPYPNFTVKFRGQVK